MSFSPVRNPIPFRKRAILLIAIMGLVATACAGASETDNAEAPESTEGAAQPASETDPSATTTVTAYQNTAAMAVIEFTACGDGTECAVVDVPLDHEMPFGPTFAINVTRHRASGDRIGNLFLNPGGPGGSVGQMVEGIGHFGPPPLTERFDLIGIDPRGTGKSGLVHCNENWEEDTTRPLTPDDGLADDVDAVIADFSEMASACEEEFGAEYLASITTENAARDMEYIRVALGAEPLNYLGYSYGTAIGSVYATLFPDSVRAMVLDGAVPNNPAVGNVDDQAANQEETLLRLDRSCQLWTECPVAEIGLVQAIADVRDVLEREGEIGPLRLHTFEQAVGAMNAIPFAVTDVAVGLADALDGNGTMLNDMGHAFLTPIPSGGFEEFGGASEAIICADGWNVAAADASELLGQAERTAAANPITGPNIEIPCDLWPVTGPGIMEVNYTGTSPILVVGNTHDPITPLAWGEALADDLGPNATLLTWDGSGHTAVFNRATQCIDDHVLTYLINSEVPAPKTVCPLRGLVGVDYSGEPVIVDGVTPGSPADTGGIEIGDRIVSMDGNPVQFEADFADGIVGEVVEFVIERDSQEIELSITRGLPVWELWRTAE